ncbi:DNA adenine methylase [Candidatus Parcubacteria bacterium]|nr:DNA adenine methylase [Patescibacteria group bacterium]MBU4482047.1 DNA adenine methylase [Patescibacteria group bacterium]MCG2687019.1 DNA adenine methylase [Candidatus Parcubacteria bacterium]
MPVFNDLNLENWKELDIWTDSLWNIPERDKTGKHSNFYHGNFIPQIPNQFIRRFTKKNETVLDPFIGSGTTAIECENLQRNCIGIDIQNNLIAKIKDKITSKNNFFEFISGDSTKSEIYDKAKMILAKRNRDNAQLVILHPPYFDILKFSNKKEDLSNSTSLLDFLKKFSETVQNCLNVLEKDRYLVLVIGDKYSQGRWYPLGFYCMNEVQKLGLVLKSVIIKNMAGNRGKRNQESIWRYRALSSDYYIFKHEYIFVFKY